MPGQQRARNNSQRKTKGQRLDEMARKRDERAIRNAYRKDNKLMKAMDSYLADDENYGSFANQLNKLGLHLRDIPGDGNCLFRALGDQLEGHGRNHFQHRVDVVNYMLEHRDDFEPFVEDDVPFDRHVGMLKRMGTYAGNDAIVAFAKLYGLNVVIHQLNSPIWTIPGAKDPETARELHISYHNGDHYSSVRRMGDNIEAPANVKIKAADLKALAEQQQHQQQYQPPAAKNGTMSKSQPQAYAYRLPRTPYNGTSTGGVAVGSTAVFSAQPRGYTGGSGTTARDPPAQPRGYSGGNRDASIPASQSKPTPPDLHRHHTTGYDSDYDNVPKGSRINGDDTGVVRVSREPTDIEGEVARQTGCTDRSLIRQTLEDQFYDVNSTVQVILHLMVNSPASNSSPEGVASASSMGHAYDSSGGGGGGDGDIWAENGTGTRIFGSYSNGAIPDDESSVASGAQGAKPKKKLTSKERKKEAKMEKKKRQEERHRQRYIDDRAVTPPNGGYHEPLDLERRVGMLKI